MNNVTRAANVYVCNNFAGILSETDDGFAFVYDKDYLVSENPSPVSLTLPLKKEAYVSKILFPFFDGLIPEGWLFNVVVKNWKLNPNDRFGILLVACKDCIGNVRIEDAL